MCIIFVKKHRGVHSININICGTYGKLQWFLQSFYFFIWLNLSYFVFSFFWKAAALATSFSIIYNILIHALTICMQIFSKIAIKMLFIIQFVLNLCTNLLSNIEQNVMNVSSVYFSHMSFREFDIPLENFSLIYIVVQEKYPKA